MRLTVFLGAFYLPGMKPRLFKSVLIALTAAFFAAAMTGCKSIPTVMPEEGRTQMNQTVARGYIPQQEVIFEHMVSQYGAGFGLVGAFVDIGITSAFAASAETRAKTLRAELKDFNFRPRYWAAISNAANEQPWLNTIRFETFGTNVPRVKAELVADGSALNLLSSYSVSPDCRVVNVRTVIDAYPRGRTKAAASVTLNYLSSRIGSEEGDDALALWMANRGEAFRRKALEGIDENAKMVRQALSLMGGAPPDPSAYPAKVRAHLVHGRGAYGIPNPKAKIRGQILSQTPERVIFQTRKGAFFSFPASDIEIERIQDK
jgi:hypothetical protein